MTTTQAPLRFLGTWKLTETTAGSSFSPWEVSLKSGIATFTQKSDGIDYAFDGEDTSGKAIHESCRCPTDGGWVPTGGSASPYIDNDQASIRVGEDGSLELNLMEGGKLTGVISTTVSADGQTITRNYAYRGAYETNPPWKPKVTATFARQ